MYSAFVAASPLKVRTAAFRHRSLLRPSPSPTFAARRNSAACSPTMAASAGAPPTDGPTLFVKAAPDGSIGDCPFSQKANLALGFRHAQYAVQTIDLSNKPQWFLDLNDSGTTPVYLHDAHAISDSDEIVDYADTVGDGVLLTREDDPNWDKAFDAVSPIFGSLVRLLKNKDDSEDAALADALNMALADLNAYLLSVPGPYLLGDQVSSLDCNLAPKLEHVRVAAKHYKAFDIDAELTAVHRFMDTMAQTEQWQSTACTEDVIVWGWSKFFT